MNKINIRDVPEKDQVSPYGKYQLRRRHLSLALGGKSDVGTWGGGHPFDVELVRIPAGAKNFPFHHHSAQWEIYLIVSGTGEVSNGPMTKPIEAGDTLVFPPEAAHQMTNTGSEDLTYYVIANQPQAEVIFYPETGEWSIKPQRKHFEMKEVPYFQPGD